MSYCIGAERLKLGILEVPIICLSADRLVEWRLLDKDAASHGIIENTTECISSQTLVSNSLGWPRRIIPWYDPESSCLQGCSYPKAGAMA